jgi:hypothetical protein
LNLENNILSELDVVLKDNKNIYDIWVYGNLTDIISDLDLIIVYKDLKKKIKISKNIKEKILDGTIIYVPKNYRNYIFLFENLKIFSVKRKKNIIYKLSKKNEKFRSLTSFLERYYERKEQYKIIKKKMNFQNLRILKSIIYSYEEFYNYTKLNNIKIKKFRILKEYNILRNLYIKNKNHSKLKRFIKRMISFDVKFCKESVRILDKKFHSKSKVDFEYKFNKNIRYIYKTNYKNDIPYVLGQIYNFYASKKLEISKHILDDFKPKNNFFDLNYDFRKYLNKKIIFLNKCYLDLKKNKYKSGLYRLTWYLNKN